MDAKERSLLLRKMTGMNRVEYAEWIGIPYRTIQEWEIGRRIPPNYLLDLIEHKIRTDLPQDITADKSKHKLRDRDAR